MAAFCVIKKLSRSIKGGRFDRLFLMTVFSECYFEWFQNFTFQELHVDYVLELCCFEWFQNSFLLIRGRPCSFIAVLFILPSYDAFFLK